MHFTVGDPFGSVSNLWRGCDPLFKARAWHPQLAAHKHFSASDLLAALCRDVLGTAQAQLVPLGSVAPWLAQP